MSDEEAFHLLVRTMFHYGLRRQYVHGGQRLIEYQFEALLEERLPAVSAHLHAQGVTVEMFASSWFASVFAALGPRELVNDMFDWFLVDGTPVLLQMAMTLVTANQESVLQARDFEELVLTLTSPSLTEHRHIAEWIALASQYPLPTLELGRLQDRFFRLQTQSREGLRQQEIALAHHRNQQMYALLRELVRMVREDEAWRDRAASQLDELHGELDTLHEAHYALAARAHELTMLQQEDSEHPPLL